MPTYQTKNIAVTPPLAELADIQRRVQRSLNQADRGDHAEGTGEQAIERAFDRGLERAGV